MDIDNKIGFTYGSLEEAFPPCDPGVTPLGSRILVQLRSPRKVTAGGLHLTTETMETELYNTQVGKVLAIGPLAFKNRNNMQDWPEGPWFEVGQFIRTPKYGGDRWTVKTGPNEDDIAVIIIFNDLDSIGLVTGDPLAMRAFL